MKNLIFVFCSLSLFMMSFTSFEIDTTDPVAEFLKNNSGNDFEIIISEHDRKVPSLNFGIGIGEISLDNSGTDRLLNLWKGKAKIVTWGYKDESLSDKAYNVTTCSQGKSDSKVLSLGDKTMIYYYHGGAKPYDKPVCAGSISTTHCANDETGEKISSKNAKIENGSLIVTLNSEKSKGVGVVIVEITPK